jgi:hypothetical protein
MSRTLWRWEELSKELTVMCRESETPLWSQKFENFADANECANCFKEIYEQGMRHGKLTALEGMRRTLDEIDRTI